MMTKQYTEARRRAISKATRHIAILFCVMTAVFYYSASSNQASAHDNHGYVWVGDQRIYNYDHRSQSQSLSNADWPIHIVFWNHSWVNRVKAFAQDTFAYNCNSFNFCDQNVRYDPTHRVNPTTYDPAWPEPQSGGFRWDTDGGRKELRCGYSGGDDYWALHYRAYDDQAQLLYNWYWGYWVPVSTHYDYDDPDSLPFSGCDNKQHGYDEEAEWNTYYTYLNDCSALSGAQNYEHWHNRNENADGSTRVRIIGGVPHYNTGTGRISLIYMPTPLACGK